MLIIKYSNVENFDLRCKVILVSLTSRPKAKIQGWPRRSLVLFFNIKAVKPLKVYQGRHSINAEIIPKYLKNNHERVPKPSFFEPDNFPNYPSR